MESSLSLAFGEGACWCCLYRGNPALLQRVWYSHKREKLDTEAHTQRRPRAGTGRDRVVLLSISQGTKPKDVSNQQQPGGRGQVLPHSPCREPTLISDFQPPELRVSETAAVEAPHPTPPHPTPPPVCGTLLQRLVTLMPSLCRPPHSSLPSLPRYPVLPRSPPRSIFHCSTN